MDRNINANNTIFGYWFYSYYALVCLSLGRTF